MKNVFIDFERIKNPYCGLGQLSKSLGQHLMMNKPESLNFIYFVPKIAEHLYPDNILFNHVHFYKKNLFNIFDVFFPNNIALWHVTNQDSDYFPYHSKGKILLNIHDLNFIRQKSESKKRKRIRKLKSKIKRSHHIVTGSHFVKNEIIKILNVPPEKISVIHNGIDLTANDKESAPSVPSGKFLFTIGEVVEKKNFHTLVQTMKHLSGFNLFIAGNNKTHYAEIIKRMISDNNLGNRVFLIGPVKDEERIWFYKNCEAFLFPSLAEGFGIPPLEAMSIGKPVFLSEETSLPEIAGPHAYYWKNFEPHSMAKLVLDGLKDFKEKNRTAEVIEHAKKYNWHNTAKQYIDLYKMMLQ